jgi:1-acyl-sn-glycerol-3-phosphate acyltransferase
VHVLEGVATTTFVFPLTSAARRRALVQRWSARLLRMLHVDTRVHGSLAADGGNVLIVANHISWLDIFVLNAVCPVRFVAKAELARWPLVGRLVRGSGTLFIERARRRDTHRVNQTVTDALAGGDVVALFPEGTTSDGASVLPFKSSLLQSIVDASGHVQPLALR